MSSRLQPASSTRIAGTIARFAVLAALTVAAAAHAGDDNYFLFNGGAEDGDLMWWGTDPSDAPIAAVMHFDGPEGTVNPQAGNYFFSFAQAPHSGTITLYQGALIPPSNQFVFCTGWIQTQGGDTGQAIMRLLDESGRVVYQQSTGPLASEPLQWKVWSVGVHVADGGDRWELELQGTLASGSVIDVFFDSVGQHIGSADLNGDRRVDEADLGELLAAWGECDEGQPCPADFNFDGLVDGVDLGLLLNVWD